MHTATDGFLHNFMRLLRGRPSAVIGYVNIQRRSKHRIIIERVFVVIKKLFTKPLARRQEWHWNFGAPTSL